ncbi:unnamed protein product [Diplocarpon coronariae]|uniref:G protein-coupled receptor: GPCR, secretin-like n=1 Tax=Diplocarpon coronariae TaxID=2795749 RepID=A0A218YYX0_9HELO|nr:G protein-coupled receptor : GPCR, secretin-like [Marssonina coronariae]
MSNVTEHPQQGTCPAPFLRAELFPRTGGHEAGRFCSDLFGPDCCLPCPRTDWLYPDDFETLTTAASWINVGGMACSVFLVLSFACLPVERTHRHYLSVCLTLAVVIMQLGFIIPLGAKPEQCFNAITPHDMRSSTTCALSGAFLLAGGWCALMWVFLRALALHLQICWHLVIGETFMWGALATGWGIPAVALTVAMLLSGVSFRFGDTCHLNHSNSLAAFWIPLLVFAGGTVFIQFGTFGYCLQVYLNSLGDDSIPTDDSGPRSHHLGAGDIISPRQAYRRVRRVIELQWRGIAIVLLILADVVFFAVIFVFMDDLESSTIKNPPQARDWLECLAATAGDKNNCLAFARHLVINEATVMTVLVLLSMNGVCLLIFLGRVSMFVGWYKLARGGDEPSSEFVSADARVFKSPPAYEMLGRDREGGKTPEPPIARAIIPRPPPAAKSGRETTHGSFGREARYTSPARSFSRPRLPLAKDDGDPAPTRPPPRP